MRRTYLSFKVLRGDLHVSQGVPVRHLDSPELLHEHDQPNPVPRGRELRLHLLAERGSALL